MASMQHTLMYQYLKIFINKAAKILLEGCGFFCLLLTNLHEPINETKQMPNGIQMVAFPKILYLYRVITDKPHSTIQQKNTVSDL